MPRTTENKSISTFFEVKCNGAPFLIWWHWIEHWILKYESSNLKVQSSNESRGQSRNMLITQLWNIVLLRCKLLSSNCTQQKKANLLFLLENLVMDSFIFHRKFDGYSTNTFFEQRKTVAECFFLVRSFTLKLWASINGLRPCVVC